MKRLNKAKINKAMNKQAVRYRHVVREYDEEVYDFDELSPEAKENAIKELRQIYEDGDYASEYMEMDAYDLEKYGDDYFLGIDLKAMGIPIENVGISWDWQYAWLCGTTTLDKFLSLCDYDFADEPIYSIISDYIDDYEGDLDFEREYSVSQNDVAACIKEHYNYYAGLLEKDIDKLVLLDTYLGVVTDALIKIFDDFNDKVEKANKYLTRNMEGYLDPSDQDILEIMDVDNYEFDEKGYII